MNLIEAIKSVPDHRHPRGIRHPLWLILMIILLGSCTGYWGYKPLAEFTKNHRSTLIKLFHLPPDIRFPCDSTFRNIIISLDFEVIAVLFNIWAGQTLPSTPGELMVIDGKSIKSTSFGGNSSYQNFVSLVSVYSHNRGWVVRHKVMENQQQSEIEVVEELVQELAGSQVVITADALHTQKKTIQLIIDGGNDYIITIKKNQSSLFKVAQKLVASVGAIDSAQTSERLHGRTTTRSTTIYPVSTQLLPAWAGVKHIIAIKRTGSRWSGKKSRRRLVDFPETHYYLSSKDWSASQFASAIRGHWLIENRLHWVKDVTLNEDNCIHRGGNAPANWAMVRQFLLSLAWMLGTNTLPEALRFMANQLEYVSELLFGLSHQDKPIKSGACSSANSLTPLVYSFDN
ncbi:ISAs1 family transposase [Microcoleus sp. Z1_B5]|uniref:ISAs1 family transposase n=1 Tax=Microcoleus sp. Z1_B5 TaxID=3055430 RepID=UPI002FD25B21